MKYTTKALIAAMTLCVSASAVASSHREAPSITKTPKVDASDFYMFNSYENNRKDYVTIIANYLPLQDAYGGPNYFALDPDALYEIHIDNNGDAVEDITFQFDFTQNLNSIEIDSDRNPSTPNVAIPLSNAGDASNPANVQTSESYNVTMVKGDRRSGARTSLGNFDKPFDYIGTKSFADYPTYARGFIKPLNLGSCGQGKVFVGQRAEGFAIDLGRVFDLINLNPLGARDGGTNILADKNVTSIAMEVPKSCLISATSKDPVIGAWTTASVRQATLVNPSPASGISTTAKKGGAWTQVSRLGMPLVNEVVIGLKDKDKFNASEPKDDVDNFKNYVFYPTLPALIQTLYPTAPAPTNFPRQDLVTAFLTGVPTVNKPANTNQVPADMLRLNTSIAAVPAAMQNDLGVISIIPGQTDGRPKADAKDVAGFPNGRRPGDDVTDIALRVSMGALCHAGLPAAVTCVPADAKAGKAPLTDGALKPATEFDSVFPYLTTPTPGAR
ncbi:DUF4331 domain-containing protein [Psychrobacter aquaticus]|uniref:DUF4331 domain-containing protein n=1 Tax=Psychrobacter aquaticus CMS 56 TaxID=1354303 RepID=U4T4Q4_9GAMM|nr:DUF4331 domain-containing protein [Psychrobacter aquaticus]ERL55131.1 hypothetical protein M917_1864 [Psychrobacter aquaticus CMS 56]